MAHDTTRLATPLGFAGPMLGVPQHACPPVVRELLAALRAPLRPRGDIRVHSPAVRLHLHSVGVLTPASMLKWPNPIVCLSRQVDCTAANCSGRSPLGGL